MSDPDLLSALDHLIAQWKEMAREENARQQLRTLHGPVDGAAEYYTNGLRWALQRCTAELEAALAVVRTPQEK